MIISHRHKFIFLKTRKTAGTSIEMWLQSFCGEDDIVTPIYPSESGHRSRNDRGVFNPINEILTEAYSVDPDCRPILSSCRDLLQLRRFYNHIPGQVVRSRLPVKVWIKYRKWCVERDPKEKVVSDYYMQRFRANGRLTPTRYASSYKMPVNSPIYCDKNGAPVVDQILRYENLHEELEKLSGELGFAFDGLKYRAKASYRPANSTFDELFSVDEQQAILRKFESEINASRDQFASGQIK